MDILRRRFDKNYVYSARMIDGECPDIRTIKCHANHVWRINDT